VHQVIARVVQPGRLFLDGGCGHGYWVKYLHDLGFRAAGVDFASETVSQIKRIDPSLAVSVGDVRALPFADESVHVYYSGGVAEHFEEGPEAVLREAARVLAPDGYFLCSVPDASPLREHVVFRSATSERAATNGLLHARRVEEAAAEASSGPPLRFFQYAFSKAEFQRHLNAAGFEVVETFGMQLLWGLLDVPVVRRAQDAARRSLGGLRALRGGSQAALSSKQAAAPTATTPENRTSTPPARPAGSFARRLALYEDRSIPVFGQGIRALCEVAPNMRMYVARWPGASR
jgi:SAM-dependent methyltransferase